MFVYNVLMWTLTFVLGIIASHNSSTLECLSNRFEQFRNNKKQIFKQSA